MHKRNRNILEKIEDAFTKTNNIHPLSQDILREELLKENLNSVKLMKVWITKRLNIPIMGIHTKEYWISRGWPKEEAYLKAKAFATKNRISPYSREFWLSKINPITGLLYTEIEADFERNSRRPTKKEYWIKSGYSEEEAINKATEIKNSNNKRGANASREVAPEIRRAVSHRCIEYWIKRGYSEEEAKKQVSKEQSTFSLEKCIEKYGEIGGKQRWDDRQNKWQDKLQSKTSEEKNDINSRKSVKINYKTLWGQTLECDGYFYMIQLNESTIKIGITSRNNIYKRYKENLLNKYEILLFKKSTINHVFQIEQLMKLYYKTHTQKDNIHLSDFGWTELFFNIDKNELLKIFNILFENKEYTETSFNEIFKK